MPPDWRSLTVTGRARSAIRRHIRQTEREEFTRLGRATVDQAFERAGKSRKEVSLRPALDRFAVATEDELFDAVGRGRVTPGPGAGGRLPGPEGGRARGRHRAPPHRGRQDRAALRARRRPDARASPSTSASAARPVPGDRIVGILEADGRA